MHDRKQQNARCRARQDEIDAATWQRGERGGPCGHGESAGRAEKLRRLKEQIRAGTYRADIKDIAMQLAAAMEPMR